jgi:hypothetical protein
MTTTTIDLLATDEALLRAIESCLNPEPLTIGIMNLDRTFLGGTAPEADTIFLILESQNLIQAGELTERVRDILKRDGRLILCMPQPIRRDALLEMGADDIITPASKSPTHIAERVLSQVISDRGIHTMQYGSIQGATAAMRSLCSSGAVSGEMIQESLSHM